MFFTGNGLAGWQSTLLFRTAPVEKRVEALRHLDVASPWRGAVLRHDTRLWDFFPEECAAFQPSILDADSAIDGASGTSDNDSARSGEMVFMCLSGWWDGWVCSWVCWACGVACV